MPLNRAGAGTTQPYSQVCITQICKLELTIHLICRPREKQKTCFSVTSGLKSVKDLTC